MPTPSLALRLDWLRPAMFACRPLTMDRPAASSDPLLIRKPFDSCSRFVFSALVVFEIAFSACSEETLLRIESMVLLLISNSACTEPVRMRSRFATWSRWWLLPAVYRRIGFRILGGPRIFLETGGTTFMESHFRG